MMKIVSLILLMFVAFYTKAQTVVPRSNGSVTVQDFRAWPKLNFILPRYADTTTANLTANKGLDSCGALISTYDNKLWARQCDPKAWVEIGKNLGNSDLLQTDATRTFDQDGGTLNFTGTGKFIIGEDNYTTSPYKFRVKKDIFLQNTSLFGDSTEGIELGSNNAFSLIDSIQGSGPVMFGTNVFRQRLVVPTGQLLLNNFWNANLDVLKYRLSGDSVRLHSQGGDFNSATKVETAYEKAAGFTGRSIVSNVSETAIFQIVPSFIGKVRTAGTASNNWIRLRGWNAAMNSYLIVNPFDTVDRYIAHISTGNISGRVLKAVDYYAGASGATNVDSAYGFVAPFTKTRNFFNGTLAMGGLTDNASGTFRPVDNSSVLDIVSTTRGVLLPRMNTTDQNAISSPANSLLIYNTDSAKHCYYNGSSWVCYGSGSASASSWDATMAVSADLNNDYISDFNNFSWNWRDINDITWHDDAGTTTRLKFNPTITSIFGPDGGTGFNIDDTVHISGVDESAPTDLFVVLINPVTGALTRANATSFVTWNAIQDPTGTQTLSFGDNELTSHTNGSNTETFWTTANNSLTTGTSYSWTTSSMTSGNLLNIVSTSTTLAAGNEGINIDISGANGTNGITATGMRINVTNTNATSGTNVAFNPSASGATTSNWAILTGSGTTDGRVGINNPTDVAVHTLLVRSINNTSNAGIIVLANNQTQSNIIGYDGMRGSSGLIISTASSSIALNSASDITITASANSSLNVDNNGQINAVTSAAGGMSVGSSSFAPTGMIDISGTNSNTYGFVVRGSGYTTGGMLMNASTSPGAGNNGFLYGSTGTIVENSSGTHSILAGMLLFAPTITGGAATVNDVATLNIVGAPSATVTGGQYSLLVSAGLSRFNGNLQLGTGNKILVGVGSNASVGQATLVGGTVTVSTTAVSSSSLIYFTVATPGGTQGFLSVGTITDATSFVINSTSATETSVINWWLIN